MSGKLDQSLDEILSTQRRGGQRRSQRRSAGRATTAPVGGIHKTTRPARPSAAKAAPAKVLTSGESKIIVSNLPKDVTEPQIKEYFAQSVGSVKKVEVSYGPNSQSRGIANVTFREPDGASKAFRTLNGLLVDSRPIKIEIIVSAAQAASVIPPPKKSLAERTTQPKPQPKSAAADKRTTGVAKAGVAGARGGRGKRGRGGRTGRPTKKTAEELDSEMADYFGGGENNENGNGAPPAATNGDAPMDDEIL